MDLLENKSKEELIEIIRNLEKSREESSSSDFLIFSRVIDNILNHLPFPIYFSDGSKNIIKYNKSFAGLFGLSFPENKKIPFDDLRSYTSDDAYKFLCEVETREIKTLKKENIIPVYSEKNQEHYFKLFLSQVSENGKKINIGTMLEITEQLYLEEEMKRTMEELAVNRDLAEEQAHQFIELNRKLEESESKLRQAVAEKDKFFSIIAHDLRSPFTALLGFSEILAEETEELTLEEIKEYSTYLRDAILGLYKLLENLLTWSRLQRGAIVLDKTDVDLYELVLNIFSVLKANAEQKGIELKTNLTSTFIVKADKMMIETVIRNLISNALKFTKAGGTITVIAEKEGGFVKVSVKDTGVGMPEKIREKLFKVDKHITTRGTNDEKGTGLGLIISKEFVEMHGGRIYVESEEGKGSTFTFTIAQE